MKYNSDRDAALHFLVQSGWATGEAGNIPVLGWYAWKISNLPAEVSPSNTEINSVLEDHFSAGYEDSYALRQSLVGHFLLTEIDDGRVRVIQFPTEHDLYVAFNGFCDEVIA